MKYAFGVIILEVLIVLLGFSTSALAAQGVDGGTYEDDPRPLVVVREIQRWDTRYASEAAAGELTQWVQTTDDNRTYDCRWVGGQDAACFDREDNAAYQCTLITSGNDNGRIFCQHITNTGVALSEAARGHMANNLTVGISNRGQVTNAPCPGGPGGGGMG